MADIKQLEAVCLRNRRRIVDMVHAAGVGHVGGSLSVIDVLTAMLPALVGQLVVVLKDSALGYGITYLELLTWSKTLGSAYANTVPAYIVAGILFVIINYTLTKLAVYLEGRLKKRRAKK